MYVIFTDDVTKPFIPADRSNARRGRIWTNQVDGSLRWLIAFMTSQSWGVSRTWTLQAHMAPAMKLDIVSDASPWGAGSDHRGQQVWEALAILVALKAWSSFFIGKRFALTVKR